MVKGKAKASYAKHIDMLNGIDYVFRKDDTIITVQERFRENKYKDYNDFTLRYRRDGNKIKARHKSEYYKMEAHFFVYGIINSSKNDFEIATDFIKHAIIDLKKGYEKLDANLIFISDNK
jgi:hypothetical protein